MRKEDFEEVCGPYAVLVYRHCLQVLGNPKDAEDAAQESMVKAYRSFASFDGKATGGWLYRIAHNVCLDMLKSASHRESPSLDEDHSPFEKLAADEETPEESYLRSARRDAVRRAMNRLPSDQQLLLDLYYGDALSYEEIANREKLSLGTVKSRISRAKDALGKWLSGDESL